MKTKNTNARIEAEQKYSKWVTQENKRLMDALIYANSRIEKMRKDQEKDWPKTTKEWTKRIQLYKFYRWNSISFEFRGTVDDLELMPYLFSELGSALPNSMRAASAARLIQRLEMLQRDIDKAMKVVESL